jgi:peptidoglycan/xylan/chitin deacetylase (PgdA/CDA1 family)
VKNAQIAVVVLFCFAVVGLTGCCCGSLSLNPRGSQAPAKLGQKVPLRTMSAGADNFRWPEGKRAAISLSFDDARLSQVDRGLPILDTYGVKATFYVVPDRVEQRLSGWKKAVANGHEIGNHTLTHPCTGNFPWSREKALEEYSLEDAERELDEANAAIERLLGVRPTTFAYPCGQKFVGRGLSVKSYVPLVAKRFVVGRGAFDEVANNPAFCDLAQVMGIDLDELDFKQVRQLVDAAVADGRWLVLFGHEVGEAGHQTTFASTIDDLCRYAQDPANGLWIDTVAAVGQYILEQRAKNK